MNTFNFYILVMVEVQKSIDDQLNLQEYVIKEISSELQELGKEAFYKEENGTKEVDISKVDAFLNTIKDQEWKALKDQKRDRLWITAVQIKLASLGYDLGSKKIDGWFGAKTREAVRQFQIAMNFPENQRDGLPGKETIQALLSKTTTESNNKSLWEKSPLNIPELKDKYEWLNFLEKTLFDTGVSTISTEKYEYKKENSEITRINKPKTMVEVIIKERFYNWKREKIKEKSESEKKDLNISEQINQIPEINKVYSSLTLEEQEKFQKGMHQISLEQKNYTVENGKIKRITNLRPPLLPQQEYFLNGKRELIKSETWVQKETKKSNINIEESIYQISELKLIYQNLDFTSKVQFKLGIKEITDGKNIYKIENNTITKKIHKEKTNMVEINQKEVFKNGKREKNS